MRPATVCGGLGEGAVSICAFEQTDADPLLHARTHIYTLTHTHSYSRELTTWPECCEMQCTHTFTHTCVHTFILQGAHHLARVLRNAMHPCRAPLSASATPSEEGSLGAASHSQPLLRQASVHVLVGHGEANTTAKVRRGGLGRSNICS